MQTLTSQTIARLRLPLMIGVVLLHNQYTTFGTISNREAVMLLTFLEQMVSFGLVRMCVPLFFVISGFLIVGDGRLDRSTIAGKWHRRVRTLLIPYLVWNLLIFVLHLLLHRTIPSEALSAFWNYRQTGLPIHFQFWFLRDLIVLSLLYPLLAAVIRRIGVWPMIVLGGIWLWHGAMESAFFFVSGMTFALTPLSPLRRTLPPPLPAAGGFALLLTLRMFAYYGQLPTAWLPTLDPLLILSGSIAVWRLGQHAVKKNRLRSMERAGQLSFFIYAFHEPLFSAIRKLSLYQENSGQKVTLAIYFLLPIAVIGISVLAYQLLHRFAPRCLSLLTGK